MGMKFINKIFSSAVLLRFQYTEDKPRGRMREATQQHFICTRRTQLIQCRQQVKRCMIVQMLDRFPAWATVSFLLHRVLTDNGTHPISYPLPTMSIGGSATQNTNPHSVQHIKRLWSYTSTCPSFLVGCSSNPSLLPTDIVTNVCYECFLLASTESRHLSEEYPRFVSHVTNWPNLHLTPG